MQQLIHHSPLGALEIPGVLGRPQPGEPFAVDDDIAATLLEQADLYSPAPTTDLKVGKLREIAKERGVDLKGLRKRDDIIDAIAKHESTDPAAPTETPAASAEPEAPAAPEQPADVVDEPDTTQENDK